MKEQLTDASPLLNGHVGSPILVIDDEASYVSNIEDPRNHWLYYTFRGFERLRDRGTPVHHFVSIATGPGIDAIGAMEILSPKRVTVTDLVPVAIERARENITRYQKTGKKIPVTFAVGNLCEPLGDDRADIIYANIPNIPIEPDRKDQLMDGITAATFFDPETVKGVPTRINKHLLALQYTFLQQAKNNLTPDGMVVVNLGARFPIDIVSELFDRAGYNHGVLYFGFKKQTEPEDTIPGYARHEGDGVTFTYYPYKQAVQLLEAKQIQDVDDLMEMLKPLGISASEGLQRSRQGEEMGHIVTLLEAKPRK